MFPSRLVSVAGIDGAGVGVGVRGAPGERGAVLCRCDSRFARPDTSGGVGLRGAVPIILATIPVLRGAPGAKRIFDVVFFIVVG